jgi:hypothetical protein
MRNQRQFMEDLVAENLIEAVETALGVLALLPS